ncbi:hypothetical protein MKW92_020630 [Papaver armeniacum]|nr:hypothetical protein MKW92_020630 [Papaver armeniacum]
MSAMELGNDRYNQLQAEMREIKNLLKVVVESQARETESQEEFAKYQTQQARDLAQSRAQQTKSQEDIQNQLLDVLRIIISANNNKQEKDNVKNNSSNLKEIRKTSGSGGEENLLIKKIPLSAFGNLPQCKEKIVRAIYKPDRNDLLLKGDCEETIKFLKNDPAALTHGVTTASSTVLHIALYKRREMKLIREIIELSSPELLEYRAGVKDNTALHYAAQHGNLEAAVLLVNKNPRLPLILNKSGESPFEVAINSISHGQKEVIEYLYSQTIDLYPIPFSGTNGAWYFCRLIEGNFYDIALYTVKKFPRLATAKSTKYGMCGMEMMVRRPFAFQSGANLTWWQNLIYSFIQVDMNTTSIHQVEPAQPTIRDVENPMPGNLDCTKLEENSKVFSSTTYKGIIMPYLTRAISIKRVYNQKLVHQQAIALIKHLLEGVCKSTTLVFFFNNNPNLMKIAIKHGIIEFIAECLEKNSNLIWERISGERMIETAITERKEMILNLLCETADKLQEKIDLVSRTDLEKNTILHYAARLAPFAQLSLVSGAALQMQREMQWFRGVESILQESDRFKRNKIGDTAQFIFTEAHKELVKEGQDWLKDTSGSCMIVGALIATVAFAAAFTAPGGNISDSDNALIGTPIFLGKSSFTVFAVSDALALFSSITSVLMFLAIYTSRFAETDFLKSLPQKLIFGLATLFISMVAILVAFGASLFIVVGSRFSQAVTPIALFASCPLGLFAWLQLPLFVEMVRSTYWGSLFQKHKSIDFSSTRTGNKSGKKMKEN